MQLPLVCTLVHTRPWLCMKYEPFVCSDGFFCGGVDPKEVGFRGKTVVQSSIDCKHLMVI